MKLLVISLIPSFLILLMLQGVKTSQVLYTSKTQTSEFSLQQKITADAILGQWLTSKGECKVEIYKKNNLYYGKIIWLKEPNDEKGHPVKDKENPDSKLKERNVIGITFMFDFQYDGEDKWTNGRIYNVDNGKTYQALVKMESNDVIYLRGYIGIPALGTDTRWTRVK